MPIERSEAAGQVHLDVQVIQLQTPAAFKVVLDTGKIVWIPKSQCVDPDNYNAGDRNCTLTVTEWIAKQKGLVE